MDEDSENSENMIDQDHLLTKDMLVHLDENNMDKGSHNSENVIDQNSYVLFDIDKYKWPNITVQEAHSGVRKPFGTMKMELDTYASDKEETENSTLIHVAEKITKFLKRWNLPIDGYDGSSVSSPASFTSTRKRAGFEGQSDNSKDERYRPESVVNHGALLPEISEINGTFETNLQGQVDEESDDIYPSMHERGSFDNSKGRRNLKGQSDNSKDERYRPESVVNHGALSPEISEINGTFETNLQGQVDEESDDIYPSMHERGSFDNSKGRRNLKGQSDNSKDERYRPESVVNHGALSPEISEINGTFETNLQGQVDEESDDIYPSMHERGSFDNSKGRRNLKGQSDNSKDERYRPESVVNHGALSPEISEINGTFETNLQGQVDEESDDIYPSMHERGSFDNSKGRRNLKGQSDNSKDERYRPESVVNHGALSPEISEINGTFETNLQGQVDEESDDIYPSMHERGSFDNSKGRRNLKGQSDNSKDERYRPESVVNHGALSPEISEINGTFETNLQGQVDEESDDIYPSMHERGSFDNSKGRRNLKGQSDNSKDERYRPESVVNHGALSPEISEINGTFETNLQGQVDEESDDIYPSMHERGSFDNSKGRRNLKGQSDNSKDERYRPESVVNHGALSPEISEINGTFETNLQGQVDEESDDIYPSMHERGSFDNSKGRRNLKGQSDNSKDERYRPESVVNHGALSPEISEINGTFETNLQGQVDEESDDIYPSMHKRGSFDNSKGRRNLKGQSDNSKDERYRPESVVNHGALSPEISEINGTFETNLQGQVDEESDDIYPSMHERGSFDNSKGRRNLKGQSDSSKDERYRPESVVNHCALSPERSEINGTFDTNLQGQVDEVPDDIYPSMHERGSFNNSKGRGNLKEKRKNINDGCYKATSAVTSGAVSPRRREKNGTSMINCQRQVDEVPNNFYDPTDDQGTFNNSRGGRDLEGNGAGINSGSGNFKHILDYISKARKRRGVSIDIPLINHQIEDAKVPNCLIRLLNTPANLNGSRERRNLEGDDAGNPSIYDLRQENEELRRSKYCIICCTNHRCVVFVPCGHLIICSYCKHHVKQICPVCRGKISEKIRVLYK